ncbi:pyruvate ferredoxin oxidoreductase [candidate division KSB3 bacterium]|uniref:Pyruvate ferredoxin oxidoreductase n=1 Tax=candidate division KSB3 bacterium TaxID=2044937 RepID=A0A9D5Q878_9BACT|nr:pyruvate ferredoxin oxidoreductase [candidate division KSB3 bacterium]MBD3327193.1 pyruvate ferredoxin oxidoreductase [candidate division KSB3 bacterium]
MAIDVKKVNVKEVKQLATTKPDQLSSGHRLCPGCAAGTIFRQVLAAAEHPLVVGVATGCFEVSTTIYPYTAWKIPYIHNAFENVAATIAGVESMYRSLKRQGRLPVDEEIKFLAIGGDGGTYDIGLQSLSGAIERGHDFLYICYNNGAYMNTGIQRSSATPYGAHATTSPSGKVSTGKAQFPKDLTATIIAHEPVYVAQASPSHWQDLMTKVRKGLAAKGPAFINVIASCNRGWRVTSEKSVEINRLAVECCFWPLFEYEDGEHTLTYTPKTKHTVDEWMKLQGRFGHLYKGGDPHEDLVRDVQAYVDMKWERLVKLCGKNAE